MPDSQRSWSKYFRAPLLALLLGATTPILAAEPGSPPASPFPEVETVANTPHLLVRRVAKPTRAALTYAAFSNNPALREKAPAQEVVDAFGTATLAAVKWDNSLFVPGDAQDELPAGGNYDPPIMALGAANYLRANEVGSTGPLRNAMGIVLEETWGGPESKVSAQRIAALVLERTSPGGEVKRFWAKVEFEPWAKVGAGLSDGDGDSRADFYVPLTSEVLEEDIVEELKGDYANLELDPEEVTSFFQDVLGELYSKIYATVLDAATMPEFSAAAPLNGPVKDEIGTLKIVNPDVAVTAKPHGEMIYNIFLIGDKATVSGAPGTAAPAISPDESATGSSTGALSTGEMPPVAAPIKVVPLPEFKEDLRARLTALGENRVLRTPAGWLFLNRSLELLATDTLKEQEQDPLSVLSETAEALKAKGITLVFVPIPTKATIYPELVGGHTPLPATEPNETVALYLDELKAKGVKVVDLRPAYREAQAANPAELLYMERDTHWSPKGLEIAAKVIAEEVATLLPAAGPQEYTTASVEKNFTTDLASMLPEAEQLALEPASVTANQVQDAAGQPLPGEQPESPVLLLGDSYTVIFQEQHTQSAGLAAHLALNLKQPVDLMGRQGGGPDVLLDLAKKQAQTKFLEKKKVVIWAMTERDLLNPPGKWRAYPIK